MIVKLSLPGGVVVVKPQHDVVQNSHHRGTAGFLGLKQKRAPIGKGQRERNRDLSRARQGEPRVLGNPSRLQIDVKPRKFRCRRELLSRSPRLDERQIPWRKFRRERRIHFRDVAKYRHDVALPFGFDLVPARPLAGGKFAGFDLKGFHDLRFSRFHLVRDLGQARLTCRPDAPELRAAAAGRFCLNRPWALASRVFAARRFRILLRCHPPDSTAH